MTNTLIPQYPDHDYHNLLNNNHIDEQPDLFQYNLLGKSGRFMFQKYNDNSFKALPVPYDQIDIQYYNDPNTNRKTFIITDADGTIYRFGRSLSGLEIYDTSTEMANGPNQIAWKCTEIISPDKKDTIFFSYHPESHQRKPIYEDKIVVADSAFAFDGGGLSEVPPVHCDIASIPEEFHPVRRWSPRIECYEDYGSNPGMKRTYWALAKDVQSTIYNSYLNNILFTDCDYAGFPYGRLISLRTRSLKEIKFRGGRIVFDVLTFSQKLNTIKIYNTKNDLIKDIKFNYSPDDTRYNLTSINIYNENNIKPEKYRFNYYGHAPNIDYPLPGDHAGILDYPYSYEFTDAWGFVNDRAVDPDSVPVPFRGSRIPYQLVYTANAAPVHFDTIQDIIFPVGQGVLTANEETTKFGILYEIIYPTGGKTVFEYESNKYKSSDNIITKAGGLRIKRISNFVSQGPTPVSERIFKYGVNENGYGLLKTSPDISDYHYTQIRGYVTTEAAVGLLVFPEKVRTYVNYSLEDNTFNNGAPVNYPEVAVYTEENGVSTGKSVSKFGIFQYYTRYFNTNLSREVSDFINGMLLEKTDFKYDINSGDFYWIRKNIPSYSVYLLPHKIHVGKVFEDHIIVGTPEDVIRAYSGYYGQYAKFTYIKYGLDVGYNRLISETDSIREMGYPSNIQTLKKNYYYGNPKHIFPTRIEYINSKQDTISTYATYPLDYTSENTMINSLVSNHKLNYPIETVTATKAGTGKIIKGTLNTYSSGIENYKTSTSSLEMTGSIPLPVFKFSNTPIGQWPGTNPDQSLLADQKYKNRYLIDSYDIYGNIAQITESETNKRQSYKWGYRGQYIIVDCMNASSNEFCFEDFEGNGTISANMGTGHTGEGSYLGSVNLNSLFNPVLNGRKYLLSYFKFESSLWKHYIEPYTGQTLNGHLDDIRIFPDNGLITTYTYKPLVGITSQTDTKGHTIYYNYDNFQRLWNITDHNGKVLKVYDYHYKE